MLGFISRVTKPLRSPEVVKTLYVSYVRSILEYCSSVWNPHFRLHGDRIEQIQHKAIRMLNFLSYRRFDTYSDAERYYGLHSLSARRRIADQVFLFKIINGCVDCPELTALINYRVPRITARHSQTFYLTRFDTSYAGNGFVRRSCGEYNNVFQNVDIFQLPLPQFRTGVARAVMNL